MVLMNLVLVVRFWRVVRGQQRRLKALAALAVTVAQLIAIVLLETIQQPTSKTNKQTMRDSLISLCGCLALHVCMYVILTRSQYLFGLDPYKNPITHTAMTQ